MTWHEFDANEVPFASQSTKGQSVSEAESQHSDYLPSAESQETDTLSGKSQGS